VRLNKVFAILTTAAMLGILILSTVSAASAKQLKVLYSFPELGDDQANFPSASLIFDRAGNLYGTATGTNSLLGYSGLVYKLTPNPDGSWAMSVLYTFTGGADGAYPFSNLTFDAAGNLYGTTSAGGNTASCQSWGAAGCGVVFKLSPNPDGSWAESVLYTFTGGSDGAQPLDGLTSDAAGNLYGTTSNGGVGGGVVFKLSPNPDGSWTENVLYAFSGGADGSHPYARPIFDAVGNLYGTTTGGGYLGSGVVFSLTPNPDGSWTENVLYAFPNGARGRTPSTSLVLDAAGNLYGTTTGGGAFYGIVFQLARNSNGSWTENVLHVFNDSIDGAIPMGNLIFDRAGNLYGTSWTDLVYGNGSLFKLSQKAGGGWATTVLYEFYECGRSQSGMILDKAGNLYGTCSVGGTYGKGAVFELIR
jgi:uncharacterized repeat protein (TIGR03803 family)